MISEEQKNNLGHFSKLDDQRKIRVGAVSVIRPFCKGQDERKVRGLGSKKREERLPKVKLHQGKDYPLGHPYVRILIKLLFEL